MSFFSQPTPKRGKFQSRNPSSTKSIDAAQPLTRSALHSRIFCFLHQGRWEWNAHRQMWGSRQVLRTVCEANVSRLGWRGSE